MFEGLLDSLKQVKKQAFQCSKQTRELLNQNAVLEQQKIQYNHVIHTLPSYSFSHSQRFTSKPQTPPLQSSFYSQHPSQKGKAAVFTKSERFKQKKKDQKLPLSVNLDSVKRNIPSVKMVEQRKYKKQIKQSMVSTMCGSEWQTQPSMNMGPAAYEVSYGGVEIKKSAPIGKATRFKQAKKNNQIPLYPKYTQTLKNTVGIKIGKRTCLSQEQLQKLKLKKQELQKFDRIRGIMQTLQKRDIKQYLYNIKGVKIGKEYGNIRNIKKGTRQYNYAVYRMLDKFKMEAGGFDNQLRENLLQKPCPVRYQSVHVRNLKMPQNQPGPDYYYCKDDLTKVAHPKFSFGSRHQKLEQIDKRDYDPLSPKKGGNILIMPQYTKKFRIQDLLEAYGGPGAYDLQQNLVKKREDFGIIPWKLHQKTKVQQMNPLPEINDPVLFPKFTQIDKNIKSALIKQEVSIVKPHLSQNQINPGHWNFYDASLQTTRDTIALNSKLYVDKETFLQNEKKIQKVKLQNSFDKRTPQVGYYDPKNVEKHVQTSCFGKMGNRGLLPIIKQQGSVDGDNLVINPDKPQNHIPKMTGHFEDKQTNQIIGLQGDNLIIQPVKPKKNVPIVNFDKMKSRTPPKEKKDEYDAIEEQCEINPVYVQKNIKGFKISKMTGRENQNLKDGQFVQEVQIQPKYSYLRKRVLGYYHMQQN